MPKWLMLLALLACHREPRVLAPGETECRSRRSGLMGNGVTTTCRTGQTREPVVAASDPRPPAVEAVRHGRWWCEIMPDGGCYRRPTDCAANKRATCIQQAVAACFTTEAGDEVCLSTMLDCGNMRDLVLANPGLGNPRTMCEAVE